MKSRLLSRTAVVMGTLNAIGQLAVWLPLHWNDHESSRDTGAYFEASQAISAHTALYHPNPAYIPDVSPHGYVYWPALAVLLAPIAALGATFFSRAWYVILLAAFWAFAVALDRLASEKPSLGGVLTWGLIVGCTPYVYSTMSLGNADPLMWALVGWALASKRGGVSLALAVHIKTYAIPALGLWMWDNRRAAVLPLGVFLAVLAATFLAVPSWPREWVAAVTPYAHQGTFKSGNFSIPIAVLRLIAPYHGGRIPLWEQHTLLALSVLCEAVVIGVSLRLKGQLRYSALLIGSMLSQPLCWGFYLVSAYTLAAILIRDTQQHEESPLRLRSRLLHDLHHRVNRDGREQRRKRRVIRDQP